jgi:hypothetical protein
VFSELDIKALGIGGEGKQTYAFSAYILGLCLAQSFKRLDLQGGPISRAGDPPGPPIEAIEEQGPHNPAVARRKRYAPSLVVDAGTVSM